MPTIKDVANMANVSIATVSRIINGKGGYSEYTKIRVLDAMKELNYQPNNLAKSLKSNSSQLIAISVPSVWHPFFSEFVYHAELSLSQHGYNTLVSSNERDQAKENEFLNMATRNKVDGIIAITYNSINSYLSTDIPFVSIDRYFDRKLYPKVALVTSDNEAGGRIAFQQLYRRGAKRIAYVGTYAPFNNSAMLRKKGFQEEAKKSNVLTKIFDLPEGPGATSLVIAKAIDNLSHLDGIFAVNDETALSLIKFINQTATTIPEDLQIVGFDGFNYLQDVPCPISSVKQSAEEMSKAAVKQLLSLISGKTSLSDVVLPISFRQGQTTRELTGKTFY
ncbi:LacI family DNA-binding transcriptional regulator [Liquorilactobacillus nagelii]|uniref:LacI family DNA-binding transcriptional regulator n=1 Tax=Liquorilactobacillus nagelii TaxID=82688 RepID=UPI0021C2A8C6|nr:LacI family DNA-binding transcriptional regulator [Liquorilactobacillus nagelii]MCP9316136.1 LacI family DNA-binding transcriptional regulator [Liquorilactobacillus nagelii]